MKGEPATSVLVGGNGGVSSPATTPRAKSEIRSVAGKQSEFKPGQKRWATGWPGPIECVALVSSAATQLALIACDKRQQQAQDTNENEAGSVAGAAGRSREPEDEDSAPDAAANFCRFFNLNFFTEVPRVCSLSSTLAASVLSLSLLPIYLFLSRS